MSHLLVSASCGLSALFWAAVMVHAKKKGRTNRYHLTANPSAPALERPVAVVVPARNEAATIERCVRSVLVDPDPLLHVVVLDDGSADGTGDILARLAETDERLRVLSGGDEPLPTGWLGKPHACQRAGEAALDARPEYLLFIDADVALEPGAVRSAVAWAREHHLDLLSAMGALELKTFWERAVQPAVVGLILAGNDLDRINDPTTRPERPLANGQFLLFRSEVWSRLGGHSAVKSAIIDDVGLSTAVVREGGTYQLVFGPKLFSCRMYTGLSEIWAGWSKNLFEGMGASWAVVAGLVGFIAGMVLLPWLAVVLAPLHRDGGVALAALLAVVAMVGARVQLDRRFGQDSRHAYTIPVGWAVLAAIAVWSGVQYHRGGGSWKGRPLPARTTPE